MLIEGVRETLEKKKVEKESGVPSAPVCAIVRTSLTGLLLQGVATSIDALSVGFQIAGYLWWEALLSAAIIAAVTLVLCYVGVLIGRKFGTKLAEKATILGGVILIVIGIKIFFIHNGLICSACLIVCVRSLRDDAPAYVDASDILAFGADTQGV
jgi:putative Mn2+ efflux pump MntP